MPSKRERKLISKNRSAHHEYFIDETFECGIELSGCLSGAAGGPAQSR